jgi:hypothetical protein
LERKPAPKERERERERERHPTRCSAVAPLYGKPKKHGKAGAGNRHLYSGRPWNISLDLSCSAERERESEERTKKS